MVCLLTIYTNFNGDFRIKHTLFLVVIIMIIYKVDIMQKLKDCGFTSYKLRNEKIFSESTMTKFRKREQTITFSNLNTLCKLLNCQPADIIGYVPDDEILE